MKPRHKTTRDDSRERSSTKRGEEMPNPVDHLGIERGQNAEKGNTINPRNIRAKDAKEAAH